MDLPAVAYECKKETDQKRLAQFPIRVQKVKRLRRQITELNRALRREKGNVTYWHNVYMQSTRQTDEAISIARKANDTTERWKELYRSADGRAKLAGNMTMVLTWLGVIVGMLIGGTIVAVVR